MNTANLQLEGLYVALSALMERLKDKGVLSEAEIEAALAEAEAAIESDPVASARPPANLLAMRFPIRMLRHANAAGTPRGFSSLTREIAAD